MFPIKCPSKILKRLELVQVGILAEHGWKDNNKQFNNWYIVIKRWQSLLKIPATKGPPLKILDFQVMSFLKVVKYKTNIKPRIKDNVAY